MFTGSVFMFSMGNLQNLYINDPEALKEMSTCTSPDFRRPSFQQKILEPLPGHGIVNSSGAIGAYQRKIIAPELYKDKIKVQFLHETHSCQL